MIIALFGVFAAMGPAPAAASAQSPIPLPQPGNTRGSVWQSQASCVQNTGVWICTAAVYTYGELAGWATSNQSQRTLYIDWKIKVAGTQYASGTESCTGATSSISSCPRSGPSHTFQFARGHGQTVCVDTIGYGYYFKDTNGSTAKVTSSDFDCITLTDGPQGIAGQK